MHHAMHTICVDDLDSALATDVWDGLVANFALVMVHGPGRDTSRGIREQHGWTEHAEFMDGLVGRRAHPAGWPGW